MIKTNNLKKLFILLSSISVVLLGVHYFFSFPIKYFSNFNNHTQDFMPDSPLDLKELKTSLGRSIWFAQTDIPVVSVGICFRQAGDYSVPSDKLGLAELLSALLEEGAGPYNSQDFKKFLLDKNINLSISSTQDNCTISFRTVKESVKDAFYIVKLILTDPRFEEQDLQRVKDQMVASLQQSLNYPQSIAKENLQKSILGEKHPYTIRIKDRIETIPHLTVDHLRLQLKERFTQSAVNIAVAGDIEEKELVHFINDTLNNLPEGKPLEQPSILPLNNLGKILKIDMDVPQTFIYFAHPGLSYKDQDFYSLFMVNRILGSSDLESRLWNEIREKRGLAYFCSTDLFIHDLCKGMIGATATKTETVDQIIQLIKEEWKKIRDNGVTQEELDLHRQFIIGSYPLSFGSTIDIVSILLRYMQNGFPIDYINKRNSYFNALTLEQVNVLTKKLFDPEQLTFIVVGRSDSSTSKS